MSLETAPSNSNTTRYGTKSQERAYKPAKCGSLWGRRPLRYFAGSTARFRSSIGIADLRTSPLHLHRTGFQTTSNRQNE